MKLQLIKNNNLNKENFFNKKELQEILNIYGSMVSSGEWKDYGIYVSKNIVSFEIYRKATENPLFEIIKNLLNPISFDISDKFVLSSIFVCKRVINPSSSFGYLLKR